MRAALALEHVLQVLVGTMCLGKPGSELGQGKNSFAVWDGFRNKNNFIEFYVLCDMREDQLHC